MKVRRCGSQPSGKGPAENFTGTVRIDPLVEAPDPARVRGASVTFEPGARTARFMPFSSRPTGRQIPVCAVASPRLPCGAVPGSKAWSGDDVDLGRSGSCAIGNRSAKFKLPLDDASKTAVLEALRANASFYLYGGLRTK